MTDPKDSNLSPIGRKWDNTPVPRPKWSLGRAALYGLATSLVVTAINAVADGGQELSRELSNRPDMLGAFLVGRLGFLPLLFVIGAAIVINMFAISALAKVEWT